MPRRISRAEAERLGAVPVEAPPRRRMTRAEAEALGAVPVETAPEDLPIVETDTPQGKVRSRGGLPILSPEEVSQRLDAGDARLREKALAGLLSFVSGGGPLVDEGKGALEALKRVPRYLAGDNGESLGDTYTKARDSARKTVKDATADASPSVSVGGVDVPLLPLAGALASSGPLGETALARLAASTFGAGLNAAGASEGATPSEVAKDTAVGGGLGLAGAGVGEVLGAAARPLARALRGKSEEASRAVAEAEKAAADKAARSAVGAVGGHTAGVANTLGRLEEIARNPLGLYSAEEVAAALERLGEPDLVALRQQMTQNLMSKAGNQGPALARAREDMLSALVAASPESVAAKAAAKLDPSKQGADFGRSLWRSVGQRALIPGALGAAGAGVSLLTGGDPVKGGLGGLAGGAFLSQPGVLAFLRNQAGNPARQALVTALAARGADTAGDLAARAGQLEGQAAGRGAVELSNEARRRLGPVAPYLSPTDALIEFLRRKETQPQPDAQAP